MIYDQFSELLSWLVIELSASLYLISRIGSTIVTGDVISPYLTVCLLLPLLDMLKQYTDFPEQNFKSFIAWRENRKQLNLSRSRPTLSYSSWLLRVEQWKKVFLGNDKFSLHYRSLWGQSQKKNGRTCFWMKTCKEKGWVDPWRLWVHLWFDWFVKNFS